MAGGATAPGAQRRYDYLAVGGTVRFIADRSTLWRYEFKQHWLITLLSELQFILNILERGRTIERRGQPISWLGIGKPLHLIGPGVSLCFTRRQPIIEDLG